MQQKLKERIEFLKRWIEYLEKHPPVGFLNRLRLTPKWGKKRFLHEDHIMQLKDELNGRKNQLAEEQAKEMEMMERKKIMQEEYQLVANALDKNRSRFANRQELSIAMNMIEGKVKSFEDQWKYFEWGVEFLKRHNIDWKKKIHTA